MNHPGEGSTLQVLSILATFSVIAYASWLWRLSRRGGRVRMDHFQYRDLVIAVCFAVFFSVLAGMGFLAPEKEQAAPLTVNMMLYGVGLNMIMAVGLLIVLALRKGSLIEFLGLRAVSAPRTLGSAILFLLAAYPGLMFLGFLMKSFSQESDEQLLVKLFRNEARGGDLGATSLIFVSAALIAPVVEELIFRGYLYGTLKRFAGVRIAAIFTSALFALIHVNVSSLPALFYLALCLVIAYEWTGSLLVPITMHALFNTTSLVGLYVSAHSS